VRDTLTAPPIGVLPLFVLPNRHGEQVNTAHLRGRRNLVLMLLPRLDTDTAAYLAVFATRREEWAWLHTVVLVVMPEAVVPELVDMHAVAPAGIPILRDGGAVRSALLPGAGAGVTALIVADTEGRVTEWHTASCAERLPAVDDVLAWAWEVAQPRGACDGGVAWARPTAAVAPLPAPLAPIGHFVIGTQRSDGGTQWSNRPRYRGTQRTQHTQHTRYERTSD